MLKVMSLMKRKEGMSYEEFRKWAKDEHPKLAEKIPGMKGYRMNVPVSENPDSPYDAISEMWWESDAARLKQMPFSAAVKCLFQLRVPLRSEKRERGQQRTRADPGDDLKVGAPSRPGQPVEHPRSERAGCTPAGEREDAQGSAVRSRARRPGRRAQMGQHVRAVDAQEPHVRPEAHRSDVVYEQRRGGSAPNAHTGAEQDGKNQQRTERSGRAAEGEEA